MAHFFNFGYFSIHNQVNCANNDPSRLFLWAQEECPRNNICIPGHNNGMCRRATTSCQSSESVVVRYQDMDSGEVFELDYQGECYVFDAPESGPQRPRRGVSYSCTRDENRPPGAQDDVSINYFTCNNNEVCIQGQCSPYTSGMNLCQDSDGGLNLAEAGQLNGPSVPWSYQDYCSNGDFSSQIREFSCGPEGLWQSQLVDCPQGTMCFYGACKTCYDSDPENKEYRRGEVIYPTGEVQSDFCLGENSGIVMQADCSEQNGLFNLVQTNCPVGSTCQLGQCVWESQ